MFLKIKGNDLEKALKSRSRSDLAFSENRRFCADLSETIIGTIPIVRTRHRNGTSGRRSAPTPREKRVNKATILHSCEDRV